MRSTITPRFIAALTLLSLTTLTFAADPARRVGVAAVDVTPDYPVRLSGFGFRRTESDGVTQKIFAKALAINDTDDPARAAVLVTVDNLGIPDYMTREVAARLQKKATLDPARLAITATHTHTAPMLKDVCPTIFGRPIAPDQQDRIDRYTKELTDKLEQVALAALSAMKPGRLEYAIGRVGFAINRRTKGGPVDHDLPVMAVRDEGGKLRAVYFSYACHCVTLSHNKISGDWAGYAQAFIEKSHPGAIALASVGCGADSNPDSNPVGDKVEVAERQAKQLTDEVERLLSTPMTPVTAPVETKLNRIELLFDTPPTLEQFKQTAAGGNEYAAHHARVQIARLERGEKLQSELSYPIQTWTFGDQLAMVFLPGEVVVDYSLRLKKELDRNRVWVNAYANDEPCYIPSERILKEGGYEGGGAMIFYDRPTKLAPGLEQKIVDEIHRQLPDTFNAPKGTEGVPSLPPEKAVGSIRTKPGLAVELVAAEPLIQSPVAIDWAADGRLFVCEMYDYPTGADGQWTPGGRVKLLTDTDADGRYDTSAVFLDNIPFPTGVTAWGRGALVCAAPDVLYAEDTDGDGKADKVEKVLSGFATGNYQARVNSLALGLDNWVYAANGLLGGTIENRAGSPVDIRNHDFRFRPLAGPLETVTGLTQQGRARDDFGRWFGCDNSEFLRAYPHEQRYLRRNPHAPAPPAQYSVPGDYDVGRIYPASRLLERFNDPHTANRATAACGLGIYRDTLLGDEYYNNAFTAETVHNLVHRMVLTEDDSGRLKRARAADEAASEFFASTDNWSRPVQIKTGPDGALYVVDMYRFLIEHPRWIPAERLAQLDVRAGANMGRIFRVRPKGKDLRPLRDLTKLSASDLAAALDTPNGTDRDRVHIELLTRNDSTVAPALEKLTTTAKLPAVRIQALAALEGLAALKPAHITTALRDPDPRVRAHALRLAEPLLRDNNPDITTAVLALATDPSPHVRRQLAFTLGESADPHAAKVLGQLATASLPFSGGPEGRVPPSPGTPGEGRGEGRSAQPEVRAPATSPNDPDLRTAILSSSSHHCGEILSAILATPPSPARDAWVPPLVATAAASGDDALLARAITAVLPNTTPDPSHFPALAALTDALDRRKVSLPTFIANHPDLKDAAARLTAVLATARQTAADADARADARVLALSLLSRGQSSPDDLTLLTTLVTADSPEVVRAAALAALRRQSSPEVATRLLAAWQQIPPSARADLASFLASRDEWAAPLLTAVKKRQVRAHEIALADRQKLLDSPTPAVRQLATEALPAAGSRNRAAVIDQYKSVSAVAADPTRGADLFAKNCAACHALNGIGREVGPDLSAIRGKDPDYFVKNILDPSAVVEPRFVNYIATMTDGRTISGIIKAESPATITLATGGGGGAAATTEDLPRNDIKTLRGTDVSMMPDGFESALPPQQMADLIAFLKSGATPKQFPGNSPRPVDPDRAGVVLLPATAAEIFGAGPITFEPEFANIGWWSGADDHAAWTTRIPTAATYDVYLDYALAASDAGNRLTLDVAGQRITAAVPPTGPAWDQYRQAKIGNLRLEPGPVRVTVRPEGQIRGALMDLRTIAFAPPGAKPTWPSSTQSPPDDGLARDPAAVARVILDKTKSSAAREAAINANPQFAAELMTELTKDLTPGTPAEYERIPWIWRVAIAAGKRNDPDQIRGVLANSLPKDNEPLHDWQSVVIGGGIINGLSLKNIWPAPRLAEILKPDPALQARYARALDLAAEMADNPKTPEGTRYDALRMLGVEPFEKRGPHLLRYLQHGTSPELQMGAVSALADVDAPESTTALVNALAHLKDHNRNLALNALLRTDARITALLDAIESKKVDPATLGDPRTAKLKNHPTESIRTRATTVLPAAAGR